jgi:Tfp pilus assembly protein PilO
MNRLLRAIGIPGVIGIGVLLACAGFWFSALAPLAEEVSAQAAALERLRNRTLYQPASVGRDDRREADLARFYGLFPPTEKLADEVARIHKLGRAAGLDLEQGEYRLERRSVGLWAYRVNLPVRGTYPQLRDFLAALLRDVPIASVEALRFERKRAADAQLDAQLRLTVHVRPPADSKP